MKFWDSSAIVPLVVPEAASAALKHVYRDDPVVVAWWGTEVECVSAIARRRRFAKLDPAIVSEGYARLDALRAGWYEVEAGSEIRETAKRFLKVHDLRAADALQLAAAFFAAEARPSTLELVTLDERLSEAANREGFAVVPTPFDR